MSLREWLGGRNKRERAAGQVNEYPRGIPDTSPASDTCPLWMSDGLRVSLVDGREDLEVVGESFYQNNLWTLVGGWRGSRIRYETVAVLVAEHDNQYDAKAVSVWISGHKVGHLSREDAAALRLGLIALQQKHGQAIALAGHIIGGGADEGRKGMLGVFLDHDPAEFGLPARTMAPALSGSTGSIRTGLSQAVLTDEADESYDLGWLSTLPGEPDSRLNRLRALLVQEKDLISRHYVFAELESSLYGLRESMPAALDEYDSACRAHDSEMGDIVSALVGKFGVVPLLTTYRQAAIRHQKAKDLQSALWWAERGIALYGENPAKSEMLLDLYKRAGAYRARIDRSAG
jgi:hypothetical protein